MDARPNFLQDGTAKALRAAGLNVCPAFPSDWNGARGAPKAPALETWADLKERVASDTEVSAWYWTGRQIGIFCGNVSGGLEAIDFDIPNKHELRERGERGVPPLLEAWEAMVREHGGEELLSRLVVEESPSGGRHYIYRCKTTRKTGDGTPKKLAHIPWPKEDGTPGFKDCIELQSNGAFLVAAPSPGYRLVQGDLLHIPEIDEDERELLLGAARILDEKPAEPSHPPSTSRSHSTSTAGRPGDAFNESASLSQLLTSKGWTVLGRGRRGGHYVRRPGKTKGQSGELWEGDDPHFIPYTDQTDFEPGRSYRPFDVYAILNHGGDFKAAAKQLRAEGYGGPEYRPPSNAASSDQPAPLEPSDDEGLPRILITDRQMRDVSGEALRSLIRANDPPEIFVRGGDMVRVAADELAVPRIQPLSESRLRHKLARCANWFEWTRKAEKAINPPRDIAADILAMPAWPGIPPLFAIATAPVLTPDGTILVTPGYCPQARVLVAHSLDIPPWQGTTQEAVQYLTLELFSDFPFTSEADMAHSFALLFLPFIRPVISGPTPLHMVDAPRRGSGKSKLVQLCASLFEGAIPESTTVPFKEEDFKKKLLAVLLEGWPTVFLDNIDHRVDSATLAAILTSPYYSDRILGLSKTSGKVPNRCTWAATSNNGQLSSDLTRRTVWIRIDPQREDPENRTGFRHPNLIEWVMANRSQVLSAVLHCIGSWSAAGRPPYSEKPKGSFEAWSAAMGGLLEHLGIPEFLGNEAEMNAALNPDDVAWSDLFQRAHREHGGQPVTASDLWPLVENDDAILAMLSSKDPKKSLSIQLRKIVGRVYVGVRLTTATKSQGFARFKFSPVGDSCESCDSLSESARTREQEPLDIGDARDTRAYGPSEGFNSHNSHNSHDEPSGIESREVTL